MRIIRFQMEDNPPQTGWIHEGNKRSMVGLIEGHLYGEFRRLEADILLDDVRLLAPVQPSKIICIGRNYAAHAEEHGTEIPEVPLLFLKPPTAIIGTEEAIVLPPQSKMVEHEAELVLVVGKTGRWISIGEATDYLIGYTIGNDVTARDLQSRDGQWTRAKGFDTFCPIGPWIETNFNPADALITCHVNGVLQQMASTRDMVFNVDQLIAFISSVMTLLPGDIIMTGTPSGVSQIEPSDTVEIAIEGLGTLSNPITTGQT